MLIRDLPPDERPAERLVRQGPQTLSDAELLSIILGGQTALRVARRVLRDGLPKLRNRVADSGLSPARKVRLLAVLEFARRMSALRTPLARVLLNPEDIAPKLLAKYSHLEQEHFGAVFLDSRRRIIAERILTVGSATSASAPAREVLKAALLENATAIVLFHNHPSGDPEPSGDDLTTTKYLRQAAAYVAIELLDHLILGDGQHYSFARTGRL